MSLLSLQVVISILKTPLFVEEIPQQYDPTGKFTQLV
jgi:hypothetical protein